MTTVNLQYYPYPVSISVLDNQLTVITMTTPSDLVRVRFIARVGSMQDGLNKGLAHLYEHLSYLGTNRQPMRPCLWRLREKGIQSGASTGKYEMRFNASGLREYAAKIIAALGKVVFSFATTQKSLDKERLVIAQERRGEYLEDNFARWMLELMYPSRKDISTPCLGYDETVAEITLETLYQFHNDWFIPTNLALIAIGNVKHEDILKISGGLNIKNHRGKISPPLTPLEPTYASGVYTCQDRPPETLICLPLPPDEKELACLDFAAAMLTHDMASILTRRLRQQRTRVYALGYDSQNFPLLFFPIGGGADPKSFNLVEKVVLAEIKKISQGQLPRQVFLTAKADKITLVRTRRHEFSAGEWMGILSDDWLFGRLYDDMDWSSFWEEITPGQIIATVAKHWSGEKHGRFDVVNP